MKCDFGLAIVKGLVEHQDGTSYFGSLMGYSSHVFDATRRGLIAGDLKEGISLTERGRMLYDALALSTLPQQKLSRAYAWDWSGIDDSPMLEGEKQ